MRYLIQKPNGELYEVLILPYKGTNKYSFVNLTKGHICSCTFDSVEDAIFDLENRKRVRLVKDFWKMND